MTNEVPSFDLSPAQLAYIGEVGAALFKGHQLQASHRGLISIRPISQATNEKGVENEQWKGSRRPAAEPRSRRQGPPSAADSVGSVFRRVHYRAQIKDVDACYPESRTWFRDDGMWIAVRSFPIGTDGPQADFIIALPKREAARITAWGFWTTSGGLKWIGHRHTNYPDGSICAFPADGDVWREGHSLSVYVDLLSEWSFRQLYLATHGRWPGRQEGRWRYYRLTETLPGECCPRCRGLSLYEECCRRKDELESRQTDRAKFIADVGCDIGEQRPHDRVFAFAAGQRQQPPRIAYIHPAVRVKRWAWDD